MINYHSGMRMIVFYSPQVIFYQIPTPVSLSAGLIAMEIPLPPKEVQISVAFELNCMGSLEIQTLMVSRFENSAEQQ